MAIIICVCDYWKKREYFQIATETNELQESVLASSSKISNDVKRLLLPRLLRRLRIVIDGIEAFYLLRELKQFTELRRALYANPALRGLKLLWLEIVPPAKQIIDYKWNRMVIYSLYEHIEMDNLMCWLSTLGGGYSALGEQFSRCAETAGKISLKQLYIGLRVGDPFLQARCKLYYAISLIQTGRLRTAKHLVRQQYEFARLHKETDGRLVKMCIGIWLRIQYEYGLRLQTKKRKQMKVGMGMNQKSGAYDYANNESYTIS